MKTENYKFSNVPSGIANSAQQGINELAAIITAPLNTEILPKKT